MKYTITHTAEWVLLVILDLLFIFTAYKAYTLKHDVEYITTTDTIFVSDTITNLQYDTVYFSHYDTAFLPVVINDTTTVVKVDSVFVQIPISTYHYDTTITDTNYTTQFSATVSGFNVTVDTCTINTKIMPVQFKKQPFWHNIVPAVGIGYGTAGWGAFVGIGYNLSKK